MMWTTTVVLTSGDIALAVSCAFMLFTLGVKYGVRVENSNWLNSYRVGTSRMIRGAFYYIVREGDHGQR